MRFPFSVVSFALAFAAHADKLPPVEMLGQYQLRSARCGSQEISVSSFETLLTVEPKALTFTTVRQLGLTHPLSLECRTTQRAEILAEKSAPSLIALAGIDNQTSCSTANGEMVSDRQSRVEETEAGVLAYTHSEPSLRLIYLNGQEPPCEGSKDGLELDFERVPRK